MLTDLMMDLPWVKVVHFIQEEVQSLDVAVAAAVDSEDGKKIREENVSQARTIMGGELAIRVRFVNEMARHPESGKVQQVL